MLTGQAGSNNTLTGAAIVSATLTSSSAAGFSGTTSGTTPVAVGGGFVGINTINAAGTGTLTGENVTATWSVATTDTYTDNLSHVLTFSGFTNLTGGTGNDSFVLGAGASVPGIISGDGGTNTLTGPNSANTWYIGSTGHNNAGTLVSSGVTFTFSNFQNLAGGTASDEFIFEQVSGVQYGVTGSVAGGSSGTLNFDYINGPTNVAYLTSVTVTLGTAVLPGSVSAGTTQLHVYERRGRIGQYRLQQHHRRTARPRAH